MTDKLNQIFPWILCQNILLFLFAGIVLQSEILKGMEVSQFPIRGILIVSFALIGAYLTSKLVLWFFSDITPAEAYEVLEEKGE